MKTHHRFAALLLPLALTHCTMPTQPPATSTPTTESLMFDPSLAESGEPLPVYIGQAWTLGAQLLVGFYECGDMSNDFSLEDDYGCTNTSPTPVAFDVVSASCDDGLCDVVGQQPYPAGPGAYFFLELTVVMRAPSATLHVTVQMQDDPSVTVEQDLAIAAVRAPPSEGPVVPLRPLVR